MPDLPALLAELKATSAAAARTATQIQKTAYALAPELAAHTALQEPLEAIQERWEKQVREILEGAGNGDVDQE